MDDQYHSKLGFFRMEYVRTGLQNLLGLSTLLVFGSADTSLTQLDKMHHSYAHCAIDNKPFVEKRNREPSYSGK
jgi:hypothetical protein